MTYMTGVDVFLRDIYALIFGYQTIERVECKKSEFLREFLLGKEMPEALESGRGGTCLLQKG